jgi:hypothetical protein
MYATIQKEMVYSGTENINMRAGGKKIRRKDCGM